MMAETVVLLGWCGVIGALCVLMALTGAPVWAVALIAATVPVGFLIGELIVRWTNLRP